MGQANDNLHVPVNTTDDVLLQPSWHVLYLAACVSLIFFTVLSNSLTIFAVFHMKKLRYSVSNCYIASLSLADLFVGLFGMTFMTVNMVIYDERWGLPSVLCDLWR
ncbi:unnamed protein product, partial [Soboliphyme baturini]|uniref:G_PROTEIN_RECEP_F1_2 domain-containing protein n=1 Tax=Soboliphyme baturini TaxID=241478 RepID=A0A183I954_9BILA